MPTFSYEVRQQSGKTESGTIEGDDQRAAVRALQAKGYFVVAVRQVGSARAPSAQRPDLARRFLAPILYPVNSKSLAIFFTSLKMLLATGMNISEALHTLARQTGNPTLKQAAREMSEEAVRGRPMSSALGRYPSAFNATTMAIMEAGERSGLIEHTSDRLAKHYDRIFALEQSYRWQTFYPKMLLAALIVIPTAPTLILGGMSAWLQQLLSRALPLTVAILAAWYGWRALRSISMFAELIDRVKLGIPWFGTIARKLATARWARALATLSSAGVPVHQALIASAAASGNKAMELSLVREAKGLLEGRTLTEVIAASHAVPHMAVDLLASAERAGSVDAALDKVAEYYESETEVSGKQSAVAVGTGIYLIVAILIAAFVVKFWLGYFKGLEQFMP
jgi:type II secretory pathway component PulF